ncbi:MAG: alkaline phosphatase, partial [Muribaculum sp.]|nr:alkaline phosphatase [Muribaculum sp.]
MKKFAAITAFLLSLSSTAIAQEAKYIFYFIGDGMGMGHVMGAEAYNRTVAGNDTPLMMMQFPV